MTFKIFLDDSESEDEDKKLLQQLTRDQNVKDITQKLNTIPTSPQNRGAEIDMTGLISKAKEELEKNKNKVEVHKITAEDEIKKPEPKKSENELQWEEIAKNMNRDLILCDLDFTDLANDEDSDLLAKRTLGVIPPPPPGNFLTLPKTLPQTLMRNPISNSSNNLADDEIKESLNKKTKKTVSIKNGKYSTEMKILIRFYRR